MFVEQSIDLLKVQFFLPHDIEWDSGIDVSAPRPHRQPFERSEPHGCIGGFSVIDSSNRRAVAQMACDQLEFINVPAQHRRGFTRDEVVADAVKTVSANMVPGVENVRAVSYTHLR